VRRDGSRDRRPSSRHGNVTHLDTPAGNRAIFQRVHHALRRDGRIVLFDLLPGQAEGDLNRALYALGLALRAASGRVYGPEDLGALLAETGFGPGDLTPLAVPPYAVGMLVSKRGA
jgi:hypothetical protein